MKSKRGKILLILFDVLVLIGMAIYLYSSNNYKESNKITNIDGGGYSSGTNYTEESSTGDGGRCSNSSAHGEMGCTSVPCGVITKQSDCSSPKSVSGRSCCGWSSSSGSCKTSFGSKNALSVDDGGSVSTTGKDSTIRVSGSCSMTGDKRFKCTGSGTCTASSQNYDGKSCSSDSICCMGPWGGGGTVCNLRAGVLGMNKRWADSARACVYYLGPKEMEGNPGKYCAQKFTRSAGCACQAPVPGDTPPSDTPDPDPDPVYYNLTVLHYIVGTTTPAPNNCPKEGPTSKEEGSSYSTSQCTSGLKAGWEKISTGGDPTSGTMDSDKEVIYYYREIPKCYIQLNTGNFVFGQYLDYPNDYLKATYPDGTEIPQSDCHNPSVRMRKISNDTGQPVGGARLKLYRVINARGAAVKEQMDLWTSTADWKTDALPVGEYDLYEVEAPDGYILNKHPVHFSISVHKEVSSTDNSVGDWTYKEISFIKLDSVTGQPLVGAELAILDKNKNEIHSWISDGTPKKFKDLGPDEDDNWVDGKYYFVEKSPAPGHIIQRDPIVFYIKENGNAAGADRVQLAVNEFRMNNVPCPWVTVIKYDQDTNEKLSGAKLRLIDSAGNTVTSWTDAEKTIQVCPDQYYVEEVEAPKYYIKDPNKYEFESKEDATVTPSTIKLYNKKYPEIQIMKSDSKTRLPVQEAQLSLYKDDVLLTDFHWTEDGNIKTDAGYYNPWITTAYPNKFYFGPGTYTVKETIVPNGYIKAADFTFTVDEKGVPSTYYVDMLDIPYPEIKIGKIDAITGEYISNAKLRLTDHDGNLVMTTTDNRYWVDENGDGVIDYFKSTSDGYIKFILQPGDYTLTEVEAPENYVKHPNEIKITVTDDGIINPSEEIKVPNIPCPEISISKQTSTSTDELAGAMIKLTNKTTGEIKYVSTELEPKKVQVCVGNWEMQEITPPEGYTKDPFVKKFTVDDEGNVTKREFIFSDHLYPEVSLYKRDRATNDIVSGALLRLEKENGEVVREWTSLDVPLKLRLAPGTYRLLEVNPPEGYVKNTEAVVFEIEEDSETEERSIDIFNTPYPTVYIAKIDSVTKEPIDGAFMMITDYSGSIVDTWESVPDYHKVILAPGRYTVTETKAAPNHVFTSSTIEIEVNELGEVLGDFVREDNKIVFKLENIPYPKVKLLKVDADGNALAGAKLKLTDIDGNIIDEWISNNKFKEMVLGPGKYYLEENEAPQGYIKSNEKIEINVSDQGVATPSEIRMQNFDAPTVRINKQDSATHENIAGAELIIRRADNHKIVDTFVSTTTSHNIKLQPGVYEVLENVAPTGYKYSEDIIRFTVTDEGSDPSPVIFTNDRLKTISLAKVDSETGSLIPGAVLVVKDMNDVEIARVTTENRRVTLSKYLDAGQYKLIEEVAPEHYQKSDEVKLFTVTIDENPVLEIDFANTMMRKLCLYKTDSETGAKVAGATFRITNKANGQIIHEFETIADCYQYEVPYGTYILEEIKAPTHYQDTDQKVEFTVSSDSPRNIEVKIANAPFRDLSVAKVDTDTGELVAGAKLELTYPDGTKKEIITETDRVIIDDLYYGNYKLQEIEAPQDYKFNGQVYEFTVNDQSDDVITYDVNDYKLRLISVQKVDSEDGRLIQGVTLEIRNALGTLIDKVVTEDVPVVIHDRDNRLDYGIYTITEEAAPNGYQVNTEATVFVINKDTSRDDNNLTVVSVANTPYRKAKICKVDSETKDRIAGAKLELTYPDGTKKEIIPDEYCFELKDIVYGEYKLVELEAPTGYDRNTEELTFTVTAESDRELVWMMEDVPLREMIVYKVDSENDEKVAGAKLKLKYPDGTEKAITSTSEGVKLEGIKYGTYTLSETEAPNGYQINNDPVQVVVNSSSPKVIEVKLANTPYRKAKLCKRDSETLETVAGAVFELKYPDGNVKEFETTKECTEFDDIVYGEYELREKSTPSGYELNPEIFEFTINSSSEREFEWTIKNKPLKALSIAVIDEETKVLVPGSEVIVYDDDDNSIDDYTSGNEREFIDKLPYKKYCVKVLSVPDNYQMPSENPVCVIINKDSPYITYVDIPLKPYYTLKVVKYGVEMDKNLPGAKFELRNSNDEVVKEFVTTENATYINKLLPGSYYLLEVEAPEGYIIETDKIPVEIVTGNEITEITVIDNVEVPITGKTLPYAIISIVLGIFGVGCLNISKKSKKYE